MLRLITTKKLEEERKINKELGDKLEEQEFEISRLKSELKNQKRIAFKLNEENLGYRQERENLIQSLDDANKTIKKLKTLCTRKGVSYAHLFKGDK